MEKYYVITPSEGEPTVYEYTKEELLKAIEENYFGDVEFIDKIDDGYTGIQYWQNDIMIIKGEIVTPEPITKVIKYNLK